MKHLTNNKHQSYDPTWLRERYRFDATARCKKLETVVLNHFQGRKFIRILDVGAGLGANIRYYACRLACDQEWILVEKDLSLARTCLTELSRWAESNEWDCRVVAGGLEIRQQHRRILVHILTTSIVNLEDPINLSRLDLATANALFDLISKVQLFALVTKLSSYRIPIYATMNYRSMFFEPQSEEDLAYIGLYEHHMRRRRDFGFAMGRDCSDLMITCLENMGYEVSSGKSMWMVTSADRKMLRHMLTFMEVAISELLATPTEFAKLDKWVFNKLRQADRGQLELRVEHMDIFGGFLEEK